MTYSDINKCNKRPKYWLVVEKEDLELLGSISLKVEKLYYKSGNALTRKLAIENWLYDKCDLIRNLKVKQLFIEVPIDAVIFNALSGLKNPTSAEITFVVKCPSDNSQTSKVGIQSFKKEDDRIVASFFLSKDFELPECNQYFYQDKSFIQFATVKYIGDVTSYNIVYYNSDKVTEKVACNVDILNIMDLNKRSR